MKQKSLIKRIAEWMIAGDVGLSSRFLAACAMNTSILEQVNYPHDPDDFSRCYKLSQVLTPDELAHALESAGNVSAAWHKIHVNWDKMVALYEEEKDKSRAFKLYKFMKQLGL